MTQEIWKPVPSKPGVLASSWGRVKMPESKAKMPHGGERSYKTRPIWGSIRKASKNALHQYRGILHSKLGNMKVHRLVCEAFHGPPPDQKSVVIHLDEDGLNNRPENLKWGTQKENLNMPKFIAYCKSRTGENSPTKKAKRARS